MNITTRIAGFHFRNATKKDRWGYEVPTYSNKFGPCAPWAEGAKASGSKIEYEDLRLPVMVLHGYRVTNRGLHQRKPKQAAVNPPRKTTAEDWRKRGVMMRDSDLAFGRTPRQWQIKMRQLRDRAGAYLRGRGIWNPTVDDLERAMAHVALHYATR